jgi:ATP-dependent helicase HrpB
MTAYPSTSPHLPIDAVSPDVCNALAAGTNVVLIAPPGAGKTTRLPLDLLAGDWRNGGKIVLVQPRRLAALGAARRMAAHLGEKVGQRIGHRVRFDTKVSSATQLEAVTDGVFARMILSDPELSDIALVIFDEVHERALAADLGLAFALETQAALRPDLRIMAMSATVDGAKFQQLLGQNAPVKRIDSDGAQHAVETLHRASAQPPVEACVDAAMEALQTYDGDGLIFLPGQREIEAAARDLRDRLDERVAVHTLYGAVSRTAQDAALAPDPNARRKLVVASAIAETSLTIPGVRFVIDSGLARRPIYDPVRGLTRLETRAASRASIDQRRGRAGREAPGQCVRLWRKAQEGGRPQQDRPEMLDADLAALRLELAVWGTLQRDGLPFLDPPPQNAWNQAGALLTRLGALDERGAATALGKAMAARPTHPRLAAMLEKASLDEKSNAAWAAVLAGELTERGPLHAEQRLTHALADKRQAGPLRMVHKRLAGRTEDPPSAQVLIRHLLHAFPDRVAMRQRDDGRLTTYKLAQGMQAALDCHEPLANEPFLLVLDLGGSRKGAARGSTALPAIRLALPLDEAALHDQLSDHITTQDVTQFDAKDWSLRKRHQTRLDALTLREEKRPRPPKTELIAPLLQHLQKEGLEVLAKGDGKAEAVLTRHLAFHVADKGSSETLLERAEQWLPALLDAASPPPPFSASVLNAALHQALDWNEQQAFARQWPKSVELSQGRQASINYDHPAGPAISVRPQWLYGQDVQPTYGSDHQALLVEFLSPAQRPIALTVDLPGFWRGGWADVRKDMRARYPKHDWPQEPWKASAPVAGRKHGD